VEGTLRGAEAHEEAGAGGRGLHRAAVGLGQAFAQVGLRQGGEFGEPLPGGELGG